MIAVRKEHTAFAEGEFVDLGGSNPIVLAYKRVYERADGGLDVVLCVNNLSRFPQPVELDLSEHLDCNAGRAHRQRALPAHRRAALPVDPARSRLLLVPAGGDRRRGREEEPDMSGQDEHPTVRVTSWWPSSRPPSRRGCRPSDGSAARTARSPRCTRLVDHPARGGPVAAAPGGPGGAGRPSRAVPAAHRQSPVPAAERARAASIGLEDGLTCYEASGDADLTCACSTSWPRGTGRALTFEHESGADLATGLRAHPITTEQSKHVPDLRQPVHPQALPQAGPRVNKDLVLHRALHEIGSEQIAEPLGSISAEVDGEEVTIGMLQRFMPDAADGWVMATTSVRDYLTDPTDCRPRSPAATSRRGLQAGQGRRDGARRPGSRARHRGGR